jgi:DNA-binding NarL/FixJ family response regulator
MIKLAIVDDHVLLRHALATNINEFDNIKVVHQFSSGKELVDSLQTISPPDLIILDLNMKEMSGIETAKWLKENKPTIKVLVLTMYDSELTLIQLLQVGVRGILHKSAGPGDLQQAIMNIVSEGQYYSNHTTSKLINLVKSKTGGSKALDKVMLNETEIKFLKLACSDMTYKEVAMRMKLNPRAVDALRDQLFVKLDVKSRVGMAIVTLRHGIVDF